jgi:YD repeat-containing protein
LRVSNAQFVQGALTPDTTATGSAVISGVAINNTKIYPGELGFPLAGTVTGVTALVGLKGDTGYWIVPATIADLTTVGGYDFSTQLSFSPLTPTGTETLILRGVAADGTVGPAQIYALTVAPITTTSGGIPTMVVSLQWDTPSDMDLHVIVPPLAGGYYGTAPIEIWAKHPVGLPVPMPLQGVPPPDPSVVATAPYLDHDSNANCVINGVGPDGRFQEDVIFQVAPTAGDYMVLVDAASLCGQSDAQWTVTATTYDGYGNVTGTLGSARWEATDPDTRGAHTACLATLPDGTTTTSGTCAARLAFTFTIQ